MIPLLFHDASYKQADYTCCDEAINVLDENTIQEIQKQRQIYHQILFEEDPEAMLAICWKISDWIVRNIEIEAKVRVGHLVVDGMGKYEKTWNKQHDRVRHSWCTLKNGTIIDASADQVGLEGIRIVNKNHPIYNRYVKRCKTKTKEYVTYLTF